MTQLKYLIILLQHIIIGIVGSIGNLLVLLVYVKKLKDNETSTLFIFHLAITDLICCLLLMPINCYVEMFDSRIPSDLLCKFHTFLSISNITYSCFLMTLVAFERYFSIIWPLHKLMTKIRAKLSLSLLFFICLIIALLGALAVGIDHEIHYFKRITNIKNTTSMLETLGSNYTYVNDFALNNSTLNTNNNNKLLINNQDRIDMYKDSNLTIEFVWSRTYDCFHNDLIIKRSTFAYIRLIQNLLPVVCFVVIFILYAAIYLSVSKRRRMKKDRAAYYRQIIRRSRQYSSPNANHASSVTTRTSLAHGKQQQNQQQQQQLQSANVEFQRNNSNVTINLHSPQQQNQSASAARLASINNDRTASPLFLAADSFDNDNITRQSIVCFDIDKPNKLENGNNNNKNNNIDSCIQDTNNDKSHSNCNLYSDNNLSDQKTKLLKDEPPRPLSLSPQTPSNTNNNHLNTTPHNLTSNQNSYKQLSSACVTFDDTQSTNSVNTSIFIANIKTAFMLFVVTLIMVIVYTPALLTSYNIIPYNPIDWNLYFINNAANPLVYSFLNANFRYSLKSIFKCRYKNK